MRSIRRCLILSLAAAALAGAGSASEIAVTGTVQAVGGDAVGGARLELLPFLTGYEAGRLILGGDPEPSPVSAATCDDGGRCRLEAPDTGVWTAVARAPGFVPMHFQTLALIEPKELTTVALRPDRGVTLRVLGASGEPLAGVWVWADSSDPEVWHGSASPGWGPRSRVALTDALGRAVMPRADGEELEITLFAPGEVAFTRSHFTGGDVRLPAADFRQRWLEVRDPGGEPRAGVVVRVGLRAWPRGITDDNGRLGFAAPASGAVPILLATSNGLRRATEIPPASPGAGPFVVRLDAPLVLAGRVVDRSGRHAIAGALVWSGGDPGAFVRTDSRGRYRFSAPDDSRFWLQAESAGYLPDAVWLNRHDLGALRAPTLALESATGIEGRVSDLAGTPIPGAQVAAIERWPTRASYFRPEGAASRAASTANGGFTLSRLQPGGNYELRVSHPGFEASSVELRVPVPPAGVPIRVELMPSRAAHGTVLDEQDRPLPGTEVIARVAGRRIPGRGRQPSSDPFRAWTREQGGFEFLRLPASTVDLTFYRQGFAPLTVRGLEITPGTGAYDLGAVVLVSGTSLSGRVVDDAGEGIAGAAVHVLRGVVRPEDLGGQIEQRIAAGPPETTSDGQGRFRSDALSAGERIHLFVTAEGHAPAWLRNFEVTAGAAVTITLAPGFALEGVVVDQAGEPVSDAEIVFEQQEYLAGVRLPRGQPVVHQARSVADGRFRFAGLRPLAGTLTAFAQGLVPSPELAVALPSAPLEIVLEQGAVVAGFTLTRRREPIAGVRVMAGQQAVVSDGDGIYRIDGVATGPVRIAAHHPQYGRQIEVLRVEAGTHELDFFFAPGHEVRGRILDRAGAPVEGALVEISASSERRTRATTATDGGFRMHPVTDGRYDLRASREGYAEVTIIDAVRVDGDSMEGIEVRLASGITVEGQVLGLDFDQLSRVRLEARDPAGGVRRSPVDYQGRYQIVDLPAGDWLLEASLDGGRRQARARLTLEGELRVRQDLEFERRLSLGGRVVHNGAAVSGALISVRGLEPGVERGVVSDHQGRFLVEDLSSGTYRLGVLQSAEHLVDNRLVELDASREIMIDLRSLNVGGRVRDATSALPVAWAQVSLLSLSDGGGLRSAGCDEHGRFLLPRVSEGRYRLSVRGDGYASSEQELEITEAGVGDLDLFLTPRGSAAGAGE